MGKKNEGRQINEGIQGEKKSNQKNLAVHSGVAAGLWWHDGWQGGGWAAWMTGGDWGRPIGGRCIRSGHGKLIWRDSTVLQVIHVAREGASCGEAQLRWQMVSIRSLMATRSCVVDAGSL